jgi:hypothetical protein
MPSHASLPTLPWRDGTSPDLGPRDDRCLTDSPLVAHPLTSLASCILWVFVKKVCLLLVSLNSVEYVRGYAQGADAQVY